GHMRARAELLYIAGVCRGGAGLLGIGPGLIVGILAGLLIERGKPLARLGHMRAGAEVLSIRGEGRGGAGLLSIGPSLLVRLLAPELGDALARLRRMRAAAEILNICRIGRGGAGLLGVGPGLLVRRLAGLFVERDDALARLRYVRAGAEVLQIRRICRDGAGLLGVGPGLLVSLLARLLTGRLLLLGPRLLRIRGLAASRHEGRPRNDCNDRQFPKCGTSPAGLPTQIIRRGWPFPGLHARSLLFQRRRGSPVQYVPKLRRGQR